MRIEFNQGVPPGCVKWLWDNVGQGNLLGEPGQGQRRDQEETDAWFYERIEYEVPSTNPQYDSGTRHVPTITVRDPKLATLFALRWS